MTSKVEETPTCLRLTRELCITKKESTMTGEQKGSCSNT